MHYREPQFWIDEPPPERDLELGVGRHVAWQTPIHRKAVRRALKEAGLRGATWCRGVVSKLLRIWQRVV